MHEQDKRFYKKILDHVLHISGTGIVVYRGDGKRMGESLSLPVYRGDQGGFSVQQGYDVRKYDSILQIVDPIHHRFPDRGAVTWNFDGHEQTDQGDSPSGNLRVQRDPVNPFVAFCAADGSQPVFSIGISDCI